MAKKFFIGFSQIIVFFSIYELMAFVSSLATAFIIVFAENTGLTRSAYIQLTCESITQTLFPFLIGYSIIFIMKKLYDKTGIYIWSFSFITMIFGYLVINTVIQNVSYYGLFSFDTMLSIWMNGILVLSIFPEMFKMTGFIITKSDETKIGSESNNRIANSDSEKLAQLNEEFRKRFGHINNPKTGEPIVDVESYIMALNAQAELRSKE